MLQAIITTTAHLRLLRKSGALFYCSMLHLLYFTKVHSLVKRMNCDDSWKDFWRTEENLSRWVWEITINVISSIWWRLRPMWSEATTNNPGTGWKTEEKEDSKSKQKRLGETCVHSMDVRNEDLLLRWTWHERGISRGERSFPQEPWAEKFLASTITSTKLACPIRYFMSRRGGKL
jgi:hypothetical protein